MTAVADAKRAYFKQAVGTTSLTAEADLETLYYEKAKAGTAQVVPEATPTVEGTVKQGAATVNSTAATGSAAPAGGTGTAAGGWDTAVNRDLAIATINTTRDLAIDVQSKVNDLLAKLRTAGVIAP